MREKERKKYFKKLFFFLKKSNKWKNTNADTELKLTSN
jgi:hypothetical protein